MIHYESFMYKFVLRNVHVLHVEMKIIDMNI